MKLYFRDNFFSSGVTDILNEQEEKVGHLDLKSAFSSKIDIAGEDGQLLYHGRFPFFSGKWHITDGNGERVGILRSRFSFFKKKYSYDTAGRGSYEIVSPAFSREYDIFDHTGTRVARFEKVNGWFSSGAFLLDNQSDQLDAFELVAVVMGMHAMQKNQSAAASNAAH